MPQDENSPDNPSALENSRARRRPLPARERRRILLQKVLLHFSVLTALLLLLQSGAFLSQSEIAQGQNPSQERKLERDGEVSSENLISRETIELVQYFEGYTPTCVDWLDGHATIGYGNLLHFGPCTAADNALYVSEEEAEATLSEDLLFFRDRVRELVRVPINKEIEAALTSFSYNVGDGGLADSTLLALLNARDYRGAAEQFDLWINGPSGSLPGLVKRRNMEKDLFLRGVDSMKQKGERT